MAYIRSDIASGGGGGTQVAQGTFTLDARKYLYHDIEGEEDSVYEIPHGLDHTPTFFFMWEDGTGYVTGNTQFVSGFLLPYDLKTHVADMSCGMGSPRSSTESSVIFYQYGNDCIVADSTKITLKGSNTATNRYLQQNVTYRWIAF